MIFFSFRYLISTEEGKIEIVNCWNRKMNIIRFITYILECVVYKKFKKNVNSSKSHKKRKRKSKCIVSQNQCSTQEYCKTKGDYAPSIQRSEQTPCPCLYRHLKNRMRPCCSLSELKALSLDMMIYYKYHRFKWALS